MEYDSGLKPFRSSFECGWIPSMCIFVFLLSSDSLSIM